MDCQELFFTRHKKTQHMGWVGKLLYACKVGIFLLSVWALMH